MCPVAAYFVTPTTMMLYQSRYPPADQPQDLLTNKHIFWYDNTEHCFLLFHSCLQFGLIPELY